MEMFNKKYTDKEIDKILKSIIVLIDTREKVFSHIKLWFKTNKISYEIYGLNFGDYSFKIPKNEKLEIFEDMYFTDIIAIERKANAEEISGNLTEGRERFKREFGRGNNKIRLLIEDSSYSDISKGNYKTEFNPKSFIGSLHSIQEEFNTPFFFTDKEHSAEYIYNTFKYYLRNQLKNSVIIKNK
jgi:hypothetical protein